eukprot:CAMPEP_0183707620 /NCGR_PEP_ID=MMETSP0737-20130205/4152_1 /TAXON_ID=385413 /ORGANISM="Thalassiosira miniscula, Strain CCMP1093" /LENGTH=548 /DNA_ID=CAMNT_0025935339 /DNA_START=144 /DNA_END=1790 /DNA_ORIENTATION=-
MNLNECFQLAFPRPSEAELPDDSSNDNAPALQSSSWRQTTTAEQHQGGSIVAMIGCLASDWLSKSQTNFYIPPEYYAGYSYLYDHGNNYYPTTPTTMMNTKKMEHASSAHHSHSHHHHEHQQHHHHGRAAFVYAESNPNNLHPHHYATFTTPQQHHAAATVHNTTGSTNPSTHHEDAIMIMHSSPMPTTQTVHHFLSPAISSSSIATTTGTPSMTTIPYMHPDLHVAVPPLLLPWHFGLLCWSFGLAGILMLALPPRWAVCGGGKVLNTYNETNGNKGGYKRHWFPLRLFALSLLICQSPCSFLADYVHMTNISPWHAIDRVIAVFMMSCELLKLLILSTYTRPILYAAYLTSCAVAIYCFLQSQNAQETLDTEGFVFWHNCWHCYPLWSAVIYLVEWDWDRRWGDYYDFDKDVKEETECRGRDDEPEMEMESTMAMRKEEEVVEEMIIEQVRKNCPPPMEKKKEEEPTTTTTSIMEACCNRRIHHDNTARGCPHKEMAAAPNIRTTPTVQRVRGEKTTTTTATTPSVVTTPLRRSRRLAGRTPEISS